METIILSIGISAITSVLVSKIMAIHYLNVIDDHVKKTMEMFYQTIERIHE